MTGAAGVVPDLRLSGQPRRPRPPLRRGGRRTHRRPQDRRAARRRCRRRTSWHPSSAPRSGPGPTTGRLARAPAPGFAPADLDGAWLATTATGDPAVDHAVFGRGEARRVWVNSADDPANCSFTLIVGRPPGRPGRDRRHRRAQPRARDAGCGDAWSEEIGPEYADLLDLLCEKRGKSCGPRGAPARRPIGSRRSIPACSTWSVPGGWPKRRSCSGRVSGRRRPQPPHRAGRTPRADGGARPGRLPKALHDPGARASTSPRSCCCRRATARRSTRTPRSSTPPSATCATSSPTPRGSTPTSSPTTSTRTTTTPRWRTCSAWPPGLDSMIIGEGEILGQVREAWNAAERESALRTDAVADVPPRDRGGQAVPHRDRHRPARGVGVVGRGGRGHQPPGLARRPARARAGRGQHGRGHGAGPGRRGRTRDRRGEPYGGTRRGAGDAGRRPAHHPRRDPRLAARLRRAAGVDRRAGPARRAQRHRSRDDCPFRPRAPGRRHRRAAQHRSGCRRGLRRDPARHRRPPRLRRAVARRAPPGDRSRPRDHQRGARPSPDGPLRPRGRAARSPRCVHTPRTCAAPSSTRHGKKLDGTRSRGSRTRSRQLTRSIVNKLLHEPTVRLKDAAGRRRGELYADALVGLFGLPEPDDDDDADPGPRD